MTAPEHPRPDLRRLALIALGITAAWVITGLFFGMQHKLMIEARGFEDDLTVRLIAMTISMLVWACLTPIVIQIADLFPLSSPTCCAPSRSCSRSRSSSPPDARSSTACCR
jgi:hypothetical protein